MKGERKNKIRGQKVNETKKDRLLTKWDFMLLCLFLCIGVIGILAVKKYSAPGSYVYIYENGAIVQKISMAEEGTYFFSASYGSNTVEIQNGAVKVTEADCPDQLCVKQGAIKGDRESIICLPHKFVVEVRKE